MNCVAGSRKHDASLSVLICPACDGLGPEILVPQAVYILGLKQNVFGIFVVLHVMLLVVNEKILDSLRNRMRCVGHTDSERAQGRVPDVSSAHNVAISF